MIRTNTTAISENKRFASRSRNHSFLFGKMAGAYRKRNTQPCRRSYVPDRVLIGEDELYIVDYKTGSKTKEQEHKSKSIIMQDSCSRWATPRSKVHHLYGGARKSIASMTPFLQHIAQELLKLSPAVLQQTVVVLPSRRASVFLKHYMAQELEQPIWLPKLISIEDFIAEQSGLQLADNLSLQFKLYEVYRVHANKEEVDSLEQFLQWSHTLLYDFNEIDRYMVDANRLLTNLSDLKELEQWSLSEPELTPFQEQYIRFFEHIYIWYEAFRNKLLEEGHSLPRHGLSTSSRAHPLEIFPHKEVWFVG